MKRSPGASRLCVPLLCVAIGVTGLISAAPAAAIYRWDNGELITERDPEPETFWDIDLIYADLVGAQLSRSEFAHSDLSWAHLMDADLSGSEFMWSSLSDADLSGANLTSTHFSESSLSRADLSGANLGSSGFFECDLSNADLSGANLTYSGFTWSSLSNADFSGAVITAAEFALSFLVAEQLYSTASYQIGDLSRISLPFQDLNGWDFAGKNLTGANLEATSLIDTDLRGANLTNASLVNAELVRADLRGANMTGVVPWNQMFGVTAILPDGRIEGLRLERERLMVRDYNGEPAIGVTVESAMELGPDAALRMLFEDDRWGSTISFEPGTAVSLDGVLELLFAEGAHPRALVETTFDLFDWDGAVVSGEFSSIVTEHRAIWDTSKLYTTGEVTLLRVPEPATVVMLVVGGLCLAVFGGRKRGHS